jgi:hypothetical protein
MTRYSLPVLIVTTPPPLARRNNRNKKQKRRNKKIYRKGEREKMQRGRKHANIEYLKRDC